MECSCGGEVIELKNMRPVFVTPNTLAPNNYSLESTVGGVRITPKFRMCTICGKLEMYVAEDDVRRILGVER